MVVKLFPDRGDVIWIDFDSQAGHEQAGRRPAIVLSPAYYNVRAGLALVCPITSKSKGYPFEVELPADNLITGVVLSDQARSLDWKARNATLITRLPEDTTDGILRKLRTLL